eukprot:c15699_g1_i1 orf=218-2524(-)
MFRSTLAQVISVPHEEIAFAKPGIKHAGFQRRGQAWFCTTGLPSDVIVEVDEMVFHLHKFPLISRSGKLSELVAEATSDAEEEHDDDEDGGASSHGVCRICLQGMPGGPDAFEQVAKFCYGVKIELSAQNVATLRCAAQYLDMTEEYGERNLLVLTESFLNYVILRSWKDSVTTLQSCEALLPLAEKLSIVKKCVESIATKTCTDPSFTTDKCSLQSPDGTLLWNGISTGARPRNVTMDWWYEDISVLSLPLFKCVIGSMEEKGLRVETIAGALMYYAKKFIPGLNRRQEGRSRVTLGVVSSPTPVLPCEAEQVFLLETIESLLPSENGVVSTAFLFGLLKIATILHASTACKDNLERRIGAQLEQATLDDILIPNYAYSSETLYDVDCVQRIVQHFLGSEKALVLDGDTSSPYNNDSNDRAQLTMGSLSSAITPLKMVAKLLDAYLGEIAPDMNLKAAKFQALAECLPHYARALDDGLYRAIDIFIKGHSWMSEEEKETLCSVMDCQKLSLEACTHAAQNERLPMRVAVQVLFMEQMQLRVAVMGCLDGTMSRNSTATPDAADMGRHPSSARGCNRRQGVHLATHEDHHPDVPAGGELLATDQSRHVNVLAGSKLVTPLGNHPRDAQVHPTATHLTQRGFQSAHESRDLCMDLVGLRRRIGELESECSRLRNRLHRKAGGWAFLSAKLTCRSISDISDLSGPLQNAPPSRRHAITQPMPHSSRARISTPSHGPPLSSSASTHSLCSSSPQRAIQALFMSPKFSSQFS